MALATQLAKITQQLAQHFQCCDYRLSVAESCTGGLISAVCTEFSGASDWFECGYVCYSNHAKIHMLGVNQKTLNSYGAVSENTVLEMVKSCQCQSSVMASVAVSGIAGPGGGTTEKPVGTVCIAWAIGDHCYVQTNHFSRQKNREEIRYLTAIEALSGVLKYSLLK